MTRKVFTILVVCVFAHMCSDCIANDPKPNIIYILADDLGYGDVSCFNENSKIRTPHIDRLAAGGMRFTDAHTNSAVCTPTRYGILTGRYAWRSSLKKGVLNGYSKALIPQDRLTVASFLKKQGYTTAGIGKWHLGWDWKNIDAGREGVDFSQSVENGPTTIGFDYFYGFCGSLDMAPYVWLENDRPTMVPTKTTVNKDGQGWWREGLTSDDFDHEQVLPKITQKAIEFIKKQENNAASFFLYLPLPAPHTPILPTAEFKGISGLDNPYGDFVVMVDWVVGEITKTLKEQGIEGNTLVIFTSDNGCSPAANFEQLATQGHDPSHVFRGHKADIFEGGHRVPFVLRWPAKVKPGASDQLVCTTDLFATLADLFDTRIEDGAAEDSYSFLSALDLKSKAQVRKSIVHHSINGSFALRKGEWKVIFCPGSGGWSDPRPGADGTDVLPAVQLYNLKNDIKEQHNLQSRHPEIAEEYRRILSEYVTRGRSTEGKIQMNDGPESWPELGWMTHSPPHKR